MTISSLLVAHLSSMAAGMRTHDEEMQRHLCAMDWLSGKNCFYRVFSMATAAIFTARTSFLYLSANTILSIPFSIYLTGQKCGE